jgi:phosphoglycolate phosphatase-like HAD superfamily hydrolase
MANDSSGLHLVLWDIDHTLIESRGVGSELFRAAFESITGRKMEHQADVTGKTEPVILTETLRMHGIEASDSLQQQYAEALAEQYRRHVDLLRRRGRALPGAREALQALAERGSFVQTVLTGNFRAVSITKLEAFGLADHIDFEVGAYGEDSNDRASLVPIAQQRAAAKYGQDFTRHNTVIIGDTIHDVAAAHDGGAAIIAVATGRDSADELRDAGAKVMLPDLTNTAQVLAATLTTD